MARSAYEELVSTREGKRLYEQERAILEATELICRLMDERQMSRAELARRLGKTKGYVTQLLDGQRNMTIRTMSDVLLALDCTLHVQCKAIAPGTAEHAAAADWR